MSSQTWPAANGSPAGTVTCNYGSGGGVDATLTNPPQATVSDPTGTISATVDQLGRLVSYTDVWGQPTTSTYNQAGQMTATSGPGVTTSYGYDPNTGQPIPPPSRHPPRHRLLQPDLTAACQPVVAERGA